jgi:hypothetical protein
MDWMGLVRVRYRTGVFTNEQQAGVGPPAMRQFCSLRAMCGKNNVDRVDLVDEVDEVDTVPGNFRGW